LKAVSKYQVATAIAILFHAIGLAGILFVDREFFAGLTPVNLLLMGALLIITQDGKTKGFWIFFIATVVIGFFAEVIGTSTGLVFGNYSYGDVLGIKWKGVPLIIGINWFIIIYCCGVSMYTLLTRMINKISGGLPHPRPVLKVLSLVIDGATLAVILDFIIEPVAIGLGFWKWHGDIPLYNYVCWFIISAVLLFLFHLLRFNKANKFAVNLLLIQVMFFLLLRTFL